MKLGLGIWPPSGPEPVLMSYLAPCVSSVHVQTRSPCAYWRAFLVKVLAHLFKSFKATGHLFRLFGVPRADADLEDCEAFEFTTHKLSPLALGTRHHCTVKGGVGVLCPL